MNQGIKVIMETKLIKFYATWCNPCRTLEDMLRRCEVAHESVDIESEEGVKLADKYHVKNLPTIVRVDEGGKEIGRITGAVGEKDFFKWYDDTMPAPEKITADSLKKKYYNRTNGKKEYNTTVMFINIGKNEDHERLAVEKEYAFKLFVNILDGNIEEYKDFDWISLNDTYIDSNWVLQQGSLVEYSGDTPVKML